MCNPRCQTSTNQFMFRIWESGSSTDVTDASAVINADTWYHLAATYASSTGTATLYMDGVEVYSDNTVGAITMDDWAQVSIDYCKNHCYNTDARIYTYAMTDAQIAEMHIDSECDPKP